METERELLVGDYVWIIEGTDVPDDEGGEEWVGVSGPFRVLEIIVDPEGKDFDQCRLNFELGESQVVDKADCYDTMQEAIDEMLETARLHKYRGVTS